MDTPPTDALTPLPLGPLLMDDSPTSSSQPSQPSAMLLDQYWEEYINPTFLDRMVVELRLQDPVEQQLAVDNLLETLQPVSMISSTLATSYSISLNAQTCSQQAWLPPSPPLPMPPPPPIPLAVTSHLPRSSNVKRLSKRRRESVARSRPSLPRPLPDQRLDGKFLPARPVSGAVGMAPPQAAVRSALRSSYCCPISLDFLVQALSKSPPPLTRSSSRRSESESESMSASVSAPKSPSTAASTAPTNPKTSASDSCICSLFLIL